MKRNIVLYTYNWIYYIAFYNAFTVTMLFRIFRNSFGIISSLKPRIFRKLILFKKTRPTSSLADKILPYEVFSSSRHFAVKSLLVVESKVTKYTWLSLKIMSRNHSLFTVIHVKICIQCSFLNHWSHLGHVLNKCEFLILHRLQFKC